MWSRSDTSQGEIHSKSCLLSAGQTIARTTLRKTNALVGPGQTRRRQADWGGQDPSSTLYGQSKDRWHEWRLEMECLRYQQRMEASDEKVLRAHLGPPRQKNRLWQKTHSKSKPQRYVTNNKAGPSTTPRCTFRKHVLAKAKLSNNFTNGQFGVISNVCDAHRFKKDLSQFPTTLCILDTPTVRPSAEKSFSTVI